MFNECKSKGALAFLSVTFFPSIKLFFYGTGLNAPVPEKDSPGNHSFLFTFMRIEHIAIWVKDLEKVKQFYETYFNGRAGEKYINPTKGFSSYFIRFDSGCRLEIMHRNDIEEKQPPAAEEGLGLTHLAFSTGSELMVDELTQKLKKDGYTIEGLPRRTGDGYYESVVLDPENNRIEITV